MATGMRALNGEVENIRIFVFEMKVDMVMSFRGHICEILAPGDKLVRGFTKNDGSVIWDVPAGYKCYVVQGEICFKKKSV